MNSVLAAAALLSAWLPGPALWAAENYQPAQLSEDIFDEEIVGVSGNFITIPAGKFRMGSPESEAGRLPDETQHWVRLTRGFAMQAGPVTQLQYAMVMDANPSSCKEPEDSDGHYVEANGQKMNANHPVDSVSWGNIQEFIWRLNAGQDKYTYRLPTEAEWEYAARAGTNSPYSFRGNTRLLDKYGWHSGNSGDSSRGKAATSPNPVPHVKIADIAGCSHSVGRKRPNPWGLYDMHGNVWEWTQDWYGPYPAESSLSVDPKGPSSGSKRVIRGGSWTSKRKFLRSALRSRVEPDNYSSNLGFRLVRVRR